MSSLIMVDLKVKVGNDQEMAQSERNPHSKKRDGKGTKLTLRYFTEKTYSKP